jgi:hypothetical protein
VASSSPQSSFGNSFAQTAKFFKDPKKSEMQNAFYHEREKQIEKDKKL